MELYSYENYDEYKKIQIEGNIKKLNNCWVREDDIKLLSDYLKKKIHHLKFGICHGTRRGKEQEYFRNYLGIEVIGTEISPTALQFPYTIQWDFHNVKKEWINNVDFIYSNSLDHSYKPKECLDTWMLCIKKTGVCILEWTKEHNRADKLDPFAATEEEYEEIIKEKYIIKEKIKVPNCYKIFFIIAHKD